MSTDNSLPLIGLGVVVTRPAAQSAAITNLLEANGASVIQFPVIDIAPPVDPDALTSFIARLSAVDILIFISANAVRGMLTHWPRQPPANLQVAAVGEATATALADAGIEVDIVPQGRFDSEALLEHPALQSTGIQGKRVVIVRGQSGREHLGDNLLSRGAVLEYVEAYRRVPTTVDPQVLADAWQSGDVGVIVVTSNEGLENLCEITGAGLHAPLLATQLAVFSPRIARFAKALGFERPAIVAEHAGDAALIEAIIAWRQAG